ncbi:hypothetical protein RvY_00324 [Ramazzottius varieornatus]|uniref:Uncharacterized protein n=1 Tax=Ramazzottius varieornatus TaxID=947166 RepID=A0A1D1UG22_RAMVA|nr:hypothetical protein RvY_00324 [Ramazzottius varieornatus]
MASRLTAMMVPFCILLGVVIMTSKVNGQFFTKTDKAVPRLGRRMDPSMTQPASGNDQLAVPISQEIIYPSANSDLLRQPTLEDIRKWSQKAAFYNGGFYLDFTIQS